MEASVNGNGAHGRNPCPCRDIETTAFLTGLRTWILKPHLRFLNRYMSV